MRTLAEQLRDAFRESGLTLAQLIEKADVGCSPPSMSRKLAGKQVMTTDECERIARVLGVGVAWEAHRRGKRKVA